MRILVTGSRGFIASRLSLALIADGHDVTGFDVFDGKDIRDYDVVKAACHGKDAVFHLAAVADLNWARVFPNETYEINVKGTWNVARACLETGAALYFASTCCVYGNQPVHPVTEETMPRPAEIYACTKMAGEHLIRGSNLTYGGPRYNLMRFATVYGPGTRAALGTHIFLGQALRGEPITVHGEGKQTRTLTYVDDLVSGMLALLNSKRLDDVWNLTTEEEVSAIDMAWDIKRYTKSQSPIQFIPQRVGQTFKESISAAKMRAELGWVAQTSWKEGLREMLNWYVDTDQVKNTYVMPEKRLAPASRL